MKKILLIVLLLSQPIYADSNGMSKLIIPTWVSDCGDDSAFLAQEAIEQELAAFEAQLEAELAAAEMMAEIKAEFKAKAKLPNTVCGGPDILIRFCDDKKYTHIVRFSDDNYYEY